MWGGALRYVPRHYTSSLHHASRSLNRLMRRPKQNDTSGPEWVHMQTNVTVKRRVSVLSRRPFQVLTEPPFSASWVWRWLGVWRFMKRLTGVIKYLRDSLGINPDVLDPEGATALYLACDHGYLSVGRVLLRAGADVNLKCGPSKYTPFHAAAGSGHIGMVRQLVEAGGDLSARTSEDWGVPHFAVLGDSPSGLREVVDLRADLDVQDHKGVTALMVCAGRYINQVIQNASEKAQILLDGGARIDIIDVRGYTALLFAANSGSRGVVQVLLDAGASLTDHNDDGCTTLRFAAEKGHLEVVRLLCDAGADLSDRGGDGFTALMVAAQQGYLGVVRFLCDRGAGLSVRNSKGATALVFAAQEGHLEVVRYLIEVRLNTMSVTATGASPWQAAASEGHTEIVRELTAAGADMNHRWSTFNAGMTAMHLAVWKGHVDTARVLLVGGSLETSTDEDGCHPVCYIGKTWAEKNPLKEAWMRVLLARGPAFRADTWLWPIESATEISTSGSRRILMVGGRKRKGCRLTWVCCVVAMAGRVR